MNAFTRHYDETVKLLASDVSKGLTDSMVLENRAKYGRNSFTQEKQKSLFAKILESLREPMTIMLIVAAVITLAVNFVRLFTGGETDFVECVGIFVAIFLSIFITVIMEGKSQKAFEALRKINDDMTVRVIRNGEAIMIPQNEIVTGDILFVETGDRIVADGRLIESQSLMADESALTGESMPVQKDAEFICQSDKTPVAERINMVYSGSFITGGNGKVIVTGVGDNTEFGKIARELSTQSDTSTPLQEKMSELSKKIAVLGISAAVIVFVIQMIKFISQGIASFETVSEAFITSIVLIVASVPEGLPTIVAVSLALNVIKMSRQNALVKKMVASETIGCINVICSDKTGTLTENKMTVVDIYDSGNLFKPDELANMDMVQNFTINSTADIKKEENGFSFVGNPTECALLISANKSGYDYNSIRENTSVDYVYSFSSDTKNMTTVIKTDGGYRIYSKGSPEKILSLCNISPEDKKKAEDEIIRFQEKSCRIIGFAHKDTNTEYDYESQRDQVESGLIFDGFAAITDPLRKDVFDAVKQCQSAGIELKMLTGDNIITATAIANELHILDDDNIALEAKDIEAMTDDELKMALPKIRVIARSTPTVKMRVVKALKSLGNVVAVTGDGINDAPAIKNADVGVAMGITGTEVSKQASDIVLLDDSFSTIVRAVRWGRGIYENFQRFIQFQLTVNVSSVLVVLTTIILGFKAPFTALQLLWVNIIMDGPPALTLGLEPIRDDLMKVKPIKRDASIVSRKMLSRIVLNGVFMSVVLIGQNVTNFMRVDEEQMSTVIFTMFVLFQLFNAFNSRELGNISIFRNLRSNKLMLGVFVITFLLQFIITQFGGSVFDTVPLDALTWGKVILSAFSIVILSEVVKLGRNIFKLG